MRVDHLPPSPRRHIIEYPHVGKDGCRAVIPGQAKREPGTTGNARLTTRFPKVPKKFCASS
jgi:hypothetical protein